MSRIKTRAAQTSKKHGKQKAMSVHGQGVMRLAADGALFNSRRLPRIQVANADEEKSILPIVKKLSDEIDSIIARVKERIDILGESVSVHDKK